MPAGFWADTNTIFRPGICTTMNYGSHENPSIVNTRLQNFYTQSRLAFWLKEGTYANHLGRFEWKWFYANEDTPPSGDMTDPDNALYDWSMFDAIHDLPIFTSSGIGPGLLVSWRPTNGSAPNWYTNLGYTWVSSNNVEQVRWDLEAARQYVKDFMTAFHARYSSSKKFWLINVGEAVGGSSSNFPSGFSQDLQQRGYADIVNHIFNIWGGEICAAMGANSINTVINYTLPLITFVHPDVKMFTSGCTPTCTIGTAKREMQDEVDLRPIFQGLEYNGSYQPATWPSISNPFGHSSGYSAIPTAKESFWYCSSVGVLPVPLVYVAMLEWGNGGLTNLSEALVAEALDSYMAGGSDIFPYLPPSYTTTPPEGGGGTYTYVATGTGSTSGTPGQPAGKSSGDLLIMAAAVRDGSDTLNTAPAGWSLLASNLRTALFGRIATNDSSDDVSHDFWSGTGNNYAQIACFSGDVYTDLNTIVVGVGYGGGGTNNDIPSGAVAISTDNCLVIGLGAKQKTLTSNGATITSPTGVDNRLGFNWPNGSNLGFVWDYDIQTTATNIDAGIWDMSINESSYHGSIIIALQSAGTSTPVIPDVPSNVDGTQQGVDSILVSHDDESGADGYRYYLTEVGGVDISPAQFVAQRTQAQKTSDSGYEITGLTGAQSYKGTVSSYNSAGESAQSSEWSETTDTPADATPPSFAGITSATYSAVTGDVTVTFSKGSDAVTAEASLRYYAHVSTGTPDFDVDDYGPFTDVTSIIIDDLLDGTYNIGVSVKDLAGNRSTNTDTEQVVVGAVVVGGTIESCELNSGTVRSGDAYLFLAEQGAVMVVNISNPAENGLPIVFNGDGSITLSGIAGDAGRYDWLVLNADGTERGSGWVE